MGAWWGMAGNSLVKADSVVLSNDAEERGFESDDHQSRIRAVLEAVDASDERG
jgi:hypothetical protein